MPVQGSGRGGAGPLIEPQRRLLRRCTRGLVEWLERRAAEHRVPEREKGEVLAAFAAHKGEVIEGSLAAA